MDLFLLQNIIPESAANVVKELFVPQSRIDAARSEAETLPNLDITKVSCPQRLRVY